jgi:hypothetical protein
VAPALTAVSHLRKVSTVCPFTVWQIGPFTHTAIPGFIAVRTMAHPGPDARAPQRLLPGQQIGDAPTFWGPVANVKSDSWLDDVGIGGRAAEGTRLESASAEMENQALRR